MRSFYGISVVNIVTKNSIDPCCDVLLHFRHFRLFCRVKMTKIAFLTKIMLYFYFLSDKKLILVIF